MDQQTIRAYEESRDLRGKPFRSSCYAPYTSLNFNTNGDVIACCKNATYALGNEAVAAADRAIELQPRNSWFHVHRWCLAGAQRFAEAVRSAERALELAPDNPEAQKLKDHATALRR